MAATDITPTPCHRCGTPVPEDEINWACPDGALSVDHGDPYCDACLPALGTDTTSTIYDSPGAAAPGGSWFDIVTTGQPCEAVASRTGNVLPAAIRRAFGHRGADRVVLVLFPPAGMGGAR